MKVLVNIYPWESPRLYSSEMTLEEGDVVVVAEDQANEIGKVEVAGIETKEDPDKKIVRKATEGDIKCFKEQEKNKKNIINICREEIKRLELEMKLVDIKESLDGKQVVVSFTSDGRVDFRELVKSISQKIRKNVRMQQIGSRDEARRLGGYGICGRELCCAKFAGSIQSISTDMARSQQIAHRGTDRISGLCGRLMCCLAYEADQYQEMLKGMPEIYSVIKTSEGKGTVMDINAVTQEIKVKLENGKYLLIKKEEIK